MKKLSAILFLFISLGVFCQSGGVSISPIGAPPDPSAALDISYSNKGFLMPRITQAQRDSIAAPALGLEIFNTTNNCYEGFGFGNWQIISCLCTGAPSTPSSITGNSTPCINATNNVYSVSLVLGVTAYSWTVPSDATIIAGQGTNAVTVDFGTSPGNIAVTANNSCGASSASTLPVTLSSGPSTPGAISGPQSVCANSTGNVYSINAVSGATGYNWTVPSGASITANNDTSITVTFGANPVGNITVTASNACGTSSASSQAISANPAAPSTPGTISGSASVTSNSTGNVYSISAVNNATTYTWTVPSGATITDGQGTTSVTVTFGTNSGDVSVTAGNSCGTSSASNLSVTVSCYSSGSQTFSYTGGAQTFTVPNCVTAITISAYGAQGGSSGTNAGGMGGNNRATFAVSSGNVFYVYVGGAGVGVNTNGSGGGAGGFNGGGTGVNYGSGGGGASDVRYGGTALSNRVIVAGGGGGCTSPGWTTSGGTGGGVNGGDGNSVYGTNYTGKGATQSTGGAAAYYSGSVGSLGQGGTGGGPAGGGGYYGGGGADAGGGGGGSGYVTATGTSNISYSSGVQTGDGQVVITW